MLCQILAASTDHNTAGIMSQRQQEQEEQRRIRQLPDTASLILSCDKNRLDCWKPYYERSEEHGEAYASRSDGP